jgi:hypothetical protein
MKKVIFLFTLIFAADAGFAQTKMIAHRSHSGTNKTFTANGSGNLGDIDPPARVQKTDTSKSAKKATTQKSTPKKQTLTKPKVVRKTTAPVKTKTTGNK